MARHGMKSRRRFGTLLQPFNILRIRYVEKGSPLAFLGEVALEVPLNHLSCDLQRLTTAYYLMELITSSTPEKNPDARLYNFLKESLVTLNDHEAPQEILPHLEYRFLELSGFRPNLSRCPSCGEEWKSEGRYFFAFNAGAIFCSGCLTVGTEAEVFTRASLPWVLSRFIEYQMGLPLKSRKFLTLAGLFG